MKFGLPPWLKRGGDEPHEPVPCEPPRLMPGIELTPEERKGGWTEETLAEYQAGRARVHAGIIMFDPKYRKPHRPKWANNSYSPLRWRG